MDASQYKKVFKCTSGALFKRFLNRYSYLYIISCLSQNTIWPENTVLNKDLAVCEFGSFSGIYLPWRSVPGALALLLFLYFNFVSMSSEHSGYESVLNVFLCSMDRASYNMAIIIQQDATYYILFKSINCSTRFGWYFTHHQELITLCLQYLVLPSSHVHDR